MNADAGDRVADLVGKPRRHLAEESKAFVQIAVLLLHLHVREVLEERADSRPVLTFPQLRQGKPDGSRCVFYSWEEDFEAGRKVLQVDRFKKNPEEGVLPRPAPQILTATDGEVREDVFRDFVDEDDLPLEVDRENPRAEAGEDGFLDVVHSEGEGSRGGKIGHHAARGDRAEGDVVDCPP